MAIEQITYKNIDPRVRKLTMIGLALAMLVACLDGTVVGTCGTIIAQDLGGLGLYSWMVTAYMLCETVMIPIAGKLSDLYGRKPLFLIGLAIFVGGSLVAGLSVSMEMFIVCRAAQGLGGGILIPVATAAVADLYSPRERARVQGALGAIFGIGSGIGPLIGGYITEYVSWHWCFYINIPLAAAAFFLTIRKFPKPITDGDVVIDYKGIGVLSVFLVDLLLMFTWAGDKFEWASVETLAMASVAIVCLAIFVAIERKAIEPIIAPKLIHNKTVIMASIFMFLFGIALIGAMMYANMFAIMVLGLTTLEAGEYSIAMVVGMMITAMLSGRFVNRTGYRFWLIIGPIITFASLMLMSGMSVGTSRMDYAIYLFIFGFGLGCMMAVINTAVQNSSTVREMGMTTSAVNLIRSVGSTIGTAIFAVVINQRISTELSQHVSPMVYDLLPHSTGVLDTLSGIAATYAAGGIGALTPGQMAIISEMDNIILAFADSVDFSFLVGGVLILMLVIIGIFFKAVRPEGEPEDE